MKLATITNYLDTLFQVATYGGLDTSFSAKISYFTSEMLQAMESAFLQCFNGLMIRGSDDVRCITAACFLSDQIVEQLRQRNICNSLLICHHMLDIDAGLPGQWQAKGFRAISQESVEYLLVNGISVYVLHLPLDANASPLNTHYALCQRLSLTVRTELLYRPKFTMGYIARGGADLIGLSKEIFPDQLVFGNISTADNWDGKDIAILAGMVSSVAMIEEIVHTGSSLLICGDVLIRQRTPRALEIASWLSQSEFPILCLSHKRTEEPVLIDLLQHIQNMFPGTPVEFLEGEKRWK